MKDLYIIGAGGLGRKVFECVRRINEKNERWNIIGFLDDNLNALDNVKCNLSIVGKISTYIPKDNDVFLLAVSSPSLKEKMSSELINRGFQFETIISPEAIVGDFVEVGEGTIIMTPYNVETGSKIGRFVTLLGSTIAVDGQIGDYSTTAGFANLTNSKIGNKVYVASHAVLLENTTIGDNSEISAGSIVVKDVEPNVIMFGSPARVLKKKEIN